MHGFLSNWPDSFHCFVGFVFFFQFAYGLKTTLLFVGRWWLSPLHYTHTHTHTWRYLRMMDVVSLRRWFFTNRFSKICASQIGSSPQGFGCSENLKKNILGEHWTKTPHEILVGSWTWSIFIWNAEIGWVIFCHWNLGWPTGDWPESCSRVLIQPYYQWLPCT